MFGYVRPSDGKLTEEEREVFRGAYCGLCHALGRRYGLAGRMILNYDLAFLAMVLSHGTGEPCLRRCAVHPFRRRRCAGADPACATAAARRGPDGGPPDPADCTGKRALPVFGCPGGCLCVPAGRRCRR